MSLTRYWNPFTARINTILSLLTCWCRSDHLFQVPIRIPSLKGQPFFLDHLRTMAEMANDPDSQYFEVLKNGVPLGVKEPPLKSPGIWPTKEELKGESPSGGGIGGPKRTRKLCISGAPCRGHPENIFGRKGPGHGHWSPLPPRKRRPSVDVTYQNYAQALWHDGSWGGANAHIQAHTEERNYGPHSHGLSSRHAGVTEGAGTQEAPLRTLGLAQTG